MNKITIGFVAIAAFTVTLHTPARGGQMPIVTVNPARSAPTWPVTPQGQLENARRELAWRATTSKGPERLEIQGQQQRIDGLIHDLESGRTVDPAAIDELLR